MNPTHQVPLPSHEEETYMLLPSQASARLPIVPTQFPNVYAAQPASVFDGPVVVMPVSHYLGLLGMSGTSPVAAPTAVPAASPLQYSTAGAHPGASLAAEPRVANSIRQPDAEPTTPIDLSTSPSSRRKVNIACNNCHESRKPCNNARPCQRCIKRGMSSSCVNHRRKRRTAPLHKPTSSSIATPSTATSHNNISLSRPAAQQHVSLGSSSMLSFPSPTSHPLNSSIASDNVFDSSFFYGTL
ncbi:hypothetical protein V8D89_002794 [Ganoderma adspersum]